MAYRLKYRFEDLANPNPQANNSLSPEGLYYERSFYDEVAYPSHIRKGLDTWSGRIYYGKINQGQDTIVPGPANLDIISSADGTTMFALNCVVVAFEAFVIHMQRAQLASAVVPSGNPKMLNLRAQRAYTDPTALYQEYLNRLFESFNKSLSPTARNSVKDLATFRDLFVQQLHTISAYSPVTKTNYLLTQHVTMMSSGLAIDIDVGPAEDDAYKYKNYLNDPNWPFFVKCAKKYGFIVDKNIPWRLTFDLFTDASLYFIGNRISPTLGVVGKENFFAAYYTPTYFTDIGDLRNLIVNAYRLFVASNPIREEQCLRAFERGTFVVNKMARLPLASDLTDSGPTIQAVLSDKYMADMYLRLRHTESQKPFRISETVRNQMAQIYEAQHHKALTPLQNVAAYINWLFRDYIYSTNYMTYASTPALNYLLGLDISPGSGIIDSTGESSPTSGDDNSSY